jgi:ferric-dicitrate binding protein FerR (iron transport regulator)
MTERGDHRGNEEAARWFAIRRRGLMTLDERSAYRAWLRDPRNRRALSRLDEIWASLDGAHCAVDRPARGRSVRVRAALLASCLVVCIGGAGALPRLGAPVSLTELDWWSR